MKKEVFLIVLTFLIFFISSCAYYPEDIKYSPSGFIDHFDLGEDQTSHNFICYSEGANHYCNGAGSFYGCNNDQRIRMGCSGTEYINDYIQFTMAVNLGQNNYLSLQRTSSFDYLKKFEWFINGESQGVVEDYVDPVENGPCQFLSLEIPAQYTSSGQITLKFKNVDTSCLTDFQYVHAYTFSGEEEPFYTCNSDSDCLRPVPQTTLNYFCNFQNRCIPEDTGVTSCLHSSCPFGWFCNDNHECEIYECLQDADCSPGKFCNTQFDCEEEPVYACSSDSDCPENYFCNSQNICILGEPPEYLQTIDSFYVVLEEERDEHNFVTVGGYCSNPSDTTSPPRPCYLACDNYIEFKMLTQPYEKNNLVIFRGDKTTQLEWFIDDVSQGIINDDASSEWLTLEILEEYTLLHRIKIKIKHNGPCNNHFRFYSAHTFRQGEDPNSASICTSDFDCPNGYFCSLYDGQCILEEAPSGECNRDWDCPEGYYCDWKGETPTHQCMLSNPDEVYACPDDNYCQANMGINYFCVNGFCREAEPEDIPEPDVSAAIDEFDLGEDQISHNFVCYSESYKITPNGNRVNLYYCDRAETGYDCNDNGRIRMGCGAIHETEEEDGGYSYMHPEAQYIEFTMQINTEEKNVLGLQRRGKLNPNLPGGNSASTKFEWFINNESQGVVEDMWGTVCQLLELEIPEQYTQGQNQISLKFMNILQDEEHVSCGYDFQYVHAYMFKEGEFPINEEEYLGDVEIFLQLEKTIYNMGEPIKLK